MLNIAPEFAGRADNGDFVTHGWQTLLRASVWLTAIAADYGNGPDCKALRQVNPGLEDGS
jgi:hypothetical protein